MLLYQLLQNIDYESFYGGLNIPVQGVTSDSSSVNWGYLFVAVLGYKQDGHNFIHQALNKGARVVVGEKVFNPPTGSAYVKVKNSRKALADLARVFYGNPTQKLFTVGITGTNGKTTVAHLAREVLKQEETELISTILIEREDLSSSVVTTPSSPQIQKRAMMALKSGKRNLILEASSHGLDQERVRGIDFDVAVFTNLTQDHFDYHTDFDGYFKAKKKLFSCLENSDFAVVNGDDSYGTKLLEFTHAKLITYGIEKKGVDIKATKIELTPHGSQFKVSTPNAEFDIETALPGKYNIYNILAAVGIGIARKVPIADIKSRIDKVKRIEGRFESFKTVDGFRVVVDFAHNPDALEKVIKTLRLFYNRVITVFGCGGESDKSKRPIMGQITGNLSNYTIITTDNPKSENPLDIINQIEKGLSKATSEYDKIEDRGEAIKAGLSLARPGDVVLIAGKGHERKQEFKDKTYAFNDIDFLTKLDILVDPDN